MIYKQNLIDIVAKIRELEKQSAQVGFELTVQMHEFDSMPKYLFI
jgi:hypothetical protein